MLLSVADPALHLKGWGGGGTVLTNLTKILKSAKIIGHFRILGFELELACNGG